jgi:hypothetical protein
MHTRHCRVCGQPFRPTRFDALVCTSTCSMRKSRGHDLAYLSSMPPAQADARRFVHEADLADIATARAVRASRREGGTQRGALPKVMPMKVRTAVRTSGDVPLTHGPAPPYIMKAAQRLKRRAAHHTETGKGSG